MEELAASGVKYTPEDVVMIAKTPDGKLLWLEEGNDSAGLQHIVNRHGTDLAAKGVTDVPGFLNEVLQSTPVETISTAKGLSSVYLIQGQKYIVAYGKNGFIVSLYPISK